MYSPKSKMATIWGGQDNQSCTWLISNCLSLHMESKNIYIYLRCLVFEMGIQNANKGHWRRIQIVSILNLIFDIWDSRNDY